MGIGHSLNIRVSPAPGLEKMMNFDVHYCNCQMYMYGERVVESKLSLCLYVTGRSRGSTVYSKCIPGCTHKENAVLEVNVASKPRVLVNGSK